MNLQYNGVQTDKSISEKRNLKRQKRLHYLVGGDSQSGLVVRGIEPVSENEG